MKKVFRDTAPGTLPQLRGKNTLYPPKIWKKEKDKISRINLFWENFHNITSETPVDQTSAAEHERKTKTAKEYYISNRMKPVSIRKRKKSTCLKK